MKVYRGMDAGTAKPAREERDQWRGLDLVNPWESFSASRFRDLWESLLAEARTTGRPLLLSGGTALYLKAAVEGLCEAPPRDDEVRRRLEAAWDAHPHQEHARLRAIDPEAGERVHPNDRRRVVRALEVYELSGRPITSFQGQFGGIREDIELTVFAVSRPREDMDARINARVEAMLAAGWVEECERLLADPRGISPEARQALGYRELWEWLEAGRPLPLDEVGEKIKTRTRRFDRRQLTWLKHLPVVPLEVATGEDTLRYVDRVANALGAATQDSPA